MIRISGEGLPESGSLAFGERPHHRHSGAGDYDRQQKSEKSRKRSAQREPAFPDAERHDGGKQQRGEASQRHAPAHRIDDATEEREDEVSGVGALQIAEIEVAKAPRKGQRVSALLL